MLQEIEEYIIASIKENSYITSGQIAKKIDENFNIEFSRSTIHSILERHNYAWRKPIKIPKIEQRYSDEILNWWTRHTNQEWDKIIFTDKYTFYLDAPKGQKWLKIGEPYFHKLKIFKAKN